MNDRTMLSVSEKILSYIEDKLIDEAVDISGDTPLYSSGILNSMAHLKLMNFLERTFPISIPSHRVNLDNFDSLNQISLLVVELLGKPQVTSC